MRLGGAGAGVERPNERRGDLFGGLILDVPSLEEELNPSVTQESNARRRRGVAGEVAARTFGGLDVGPAKTVAPRAGFIACCRAMVMPALALPAALPHTELTTIVSSAGIGATNSSG